MSIYTLSIYICRLLKRMDVKPPRGADGQLGGEHDGIATSKHLPIFYTSLARSLIFPRLLDETDESGQVVHWSPYAPPGSKGDAPGHSGPGAVYKGSLVTDNGFWDTFRTVYPLLSIAYPDALGMIIQGWLNAYKEGGWLPSWASPGYRNCMVGTYADVVVADAIVKGVKGFEYETAYQALKKDSFTPPPGHAGGAVGKEGLNTYIEHGYLPYDAAQGEIVSRALDFAHADWAVANAFRKLAGMTGIINPDGSSTVLNEVFPGKPPDYIEQFRDRRGELLSQADTLEKRAHVVYHKLYDHQSGLMYPKDRRGNSGMHTRATEWGKGYTEGNAWHHSFIPWAVGDLSKLHNDGGSDFKPIIYSSSSSSSSSSGGGGNGVGSGLVSALRGNTNTPVHHGRDNGNGLLKSLHQMLTMNGNFQPGSYGREIHEMTGKYDRKCSGKWDGSVYISVYDCVYMYV